jgi:hypothetical protein
MGPMDPGVWLAQPGGPTGRFTVLFFLLPEDGTRIQLPKLCNAII